MPSPGAVWPAMVTFDPVRRRPLIWMWPLTAKTMVRPAAGTVAMPSRKEPAPEAFRLVTM